MQAGLERKIIRRGLTALLLTGVLLVAGATAAGTDGYGSDCSGCTSPPPSQHYGPTYPVPPTPPEAPPGTPTNPPPVLARTGSDTGTLLGIGAATAAAGAGMVVFARRRRLAVVPS